MADISKLARLVGGVLRQVDLTSNALVVGSIKIGASNLEIKETAGHFDFSAKNLTNVGTVDGRDVSADGTALDAHLNGGASKHDATEIDYERADGSKKNIDAASDDVETAITDLDDAIGALDQTPTNYTAADPTIVADHLAGIDAQLAAVAGADKYFKVSSNDTTAGYAEDKLVVDNGTNTTNPLEASTLNDGGNEDYRIRFDQSKVDHGSIAGLGDDDHTIYIKADGTRAFTGNQSMGGFKLTSLAAATAAGDAVRYEQAILANGANAFSANQSMGGFKLTSLGTPTAASDAATKGYVDNALEGLKPKSAVRVASTANVAIATALEAGDTIDGVTLVAGDRVLLKNQSSAAENGIYIASASGAASRSTDMDSLSPIDEINKSIVAVQEGTENAGKIFVQYGTVATLGTDPINFTFFNSISGLVGGDGITVSGSNISIDHDGEGLTFVANQLALELDGSTLSKSASGLKVASGGITNTEVNASAAIAESKLALDYSTSSLNTAISNHLSDSSDAHDASAISSVAAGNLVATDVQAALNELDTEKVAKSGDTMSGNLAMGSNKVTGLAAATAAGDAVRYEQAVLINGVNAFTANQSMGNNRLTSVADPTTGTDATNRNYVDNGDRAVREDVVAGETLATAFRAVRWAKAADSGFVAGRVYNADNDASSVDNFHVAGLINAQGETAGTTVANQLISSGRMAAPSHGLTVGEPIYLGASGVLTNTAPTATNTAVVKVGVARTDSIIDVKIQIMGVN